MTKTETFTEPELAVYSTLLGGGTIKLGVYGGGLVHDNADFSVWSVPTLKQSEEKFLPGWENEEGNIINQEVIRALAARNLIKVERSEGEKSATQLGTLALTDRALGGKYNSFNKTITFA